MRTSPGFPRLASLLAAVLILPLLAAGSFLRIFAYELCRADLRVRSLFVITLVYFGSMTAGLILLLVRGSLDGAEDILRVNLAGELLASLAGAGLVRADLVRSWSVSRNEIRRLLQVGKFSVGASLINLLYLRMDVFLISSFLGPVAVAVYAES